MNLSLRQGCRVRAKIADSADSHVLHETFTNREQALPMMRIFATLLVAVDGSEPSNAALSVACAMARQFGGTVHGRLVLPMHPRLNGRHVTWMPEVEADARRDAAAIARAAERLAKHLGVDIAVKVIDGDPIDELLRAADDISADAIVIGNRGHSALSTLLIGSVAQGVTERSRLPVIVVHELPAGDAGIDAASTAGDEK